MTENLLAVLSTVGVVLGSQLFWNVVTASGILALAFFTFKLLRRDHDLLTLERTPNLLFGEATIVPTTGTGHWVPGHMVEEYAMKFSAFNLGRYPVYLDHAVLVLGKQTLRTQAFGMLIQPGEQATGKVGLGTFKRDDVVPEAHIEFTFLYGASGKKLYRVEMPLDRFSNATTVFNTGKQVLVGKEAKTERLTPS